MRKLVGLISRPTALDRGAFFRRVLRQDAPAALVQLPLGRLVIDLVDVERPDDTAPLYDAVLEAWAEDAAQIDALARRYDPGAAAADRDTTATGYFYAVSERVQLDHARTWAVGQRSPGVKVIYLTRRPAGLDAREAARLWREHAPLARRHHAGMSRYVQNGVIEALTPGAPVVHGIAELHFPTMEDLEQRMYDSPAGRAVIAADAARLVAEAIPLYTSEYILRA
jgi:uncharacterized protein (TIGR02118 family)